MDKRVNKSIDQYVIEFKTEIRNKIIFLQFSEREKANELLEYVMDYKHFVLENNTKRVFEPVVNEQTMQSFKKTKSMDIMENDKDTGKSENPMDNPAIPVKQTRSVILQPIEIKGIVYYMDSMDNIYSSEDVFMGKLNPRIIAMSNPEYIQNNLLPRFLNVGALSFP